MKIAVIYQSNYGSTETYAKWIAEDLKADLLPADRIKGADLQQYEMIVYGGGLYAGKVNGITLLTKHIEEIQNKALYLFTVGTADVTNPDTIAVIRNALEKTLPPALLKSASLYHFRGGLYYSKMNFLHRTMMKMMIKMLQKKQENELSDEERVMIKGFGQDMDFTDRTSISPLVSDILSAVEER